MTMQAEQLITIVLTITANGFVAILFWWFKKLERDVDAIKQQMMNIRLNYLDRFDDLKDHISKGNLEIIQRMSKLEVNFDNHITNVKDR